MCGLAGIYVYIIPCDSYLDNGCVCVCVFSACRFLLDVSDQEMLPSEPLICVF